MFVVLLLFLCKTLRLWCSLWSSLAVIFIYLCIWPHTFDITFCLALGCGNVVIITLSSKAGLGFEQ